jgi:hypothetical protein
VRLNCVRTIFPDETRLGEHGCRFRLIAGGSK